MTFDAAEFLVFALFPKIIAFLNHARVGQNMAVATKKLGLRDIELRKLGQKLRPLVG
jgi:hypothetical protein